MIHAKFSLLQAIHRASNNDTVGEILFLIMSLVTGGIGLVIMQYNICVGRLSQSNLNYVCVILYILVMQHYILCTIMNILREK